MSDKSHALAELEAILIELNSTPMKRRSFLAAVPFLMAACASGPQSRHREGDNTGQETRITVEDERRMTAQYLAQMQKDYPPIQDNDLQAYVSLIGNRLVKANGLVGNPYQYKFTVVDVPMVNAFALPAGTIFVTAPLIQMADTEAELAGVIGHEVGHVKARHAAERIEQAEREKGKSVWYGLGGAALGAAAGYGLGRLTCPSGDNDCVARAATLGAAAGAAGGLLVQKYKFMANSREDEMEADRVGFKVAAKAGYSPQHVGLFYEKLQKMEEQRKSGGDILDSLADALSTHPPSRERIAQMQELSVAAPKNPKAIVSTTTFDKARRRVETLMKSRPRA